MQLITDTSESPSSSRLSTRKSKHTSSWGQLRAALLTRGTIQNLSIPSCQHEDTVEEMPNR
jgi:hypothetical protein